jgi:hypothetical protein
MTLQLGVSKHDLADRWSLRLMVFIGIYVSGAIILSPHSFLYLSMIYAEKFAISTPILLVLGIATISLIFGHEAPTRYAIHLLHERCRCFLLVLVFFFLGLTAFSTFKSVIPSAVPYYADNWLADMDEWLLGEAAWKIAHHFDSDVWSLIVIKSYEVLWFAQWFGTILFVALWSDKAARIRYLWAVSMTLCIIGTILALAFASVGPVYYDQFVGGHRFAGLKVAMDNLAYSYIVRDYARYLLELYNAGTPGLGGGISAMPSVHVGLAVLNALFLSSLRWWYGILGWGFAVLIFYGSIYTGWHYAVDGYVSLIVVSVIWWVSGRMLRANQLTPSHTGSLPVSSILKI